ncbi:MAG: hypothetical protein WCJ61_14185 [Paludibacter sp.]
MRLITGFLFILNLSAWILFDILCWYLTGVTLGLVVNVGIIAFLIAWGLSGEAVIAPLDYLALPEWDIFVKKIKLSNGIFITAITLSILLCIVMDWLHLREFLNVKIQ